ncbi:MAG: amidohydrolase family protein [Chthonomonadales bacterium]
MSQIIDINTMFGPHPSAAADLSVDELQSMMEKHGVGTCCTLSTVGMLLDHNSGNAATKAACSESKHMLPVATVNPQMVFDLEGPFTKFKADGYCMVRLFPDWQGWQPDYAPAIAIAKRLEVEGLPLYVEIDGSGTATRLVNALVAHPSALILGGITQETVAEAIVLMRSHARIYVETSQLVAVGAIRQVVESVGAERLLYGSGAPARPMASGLAAVKHAGLNAAQSEKVLGRNAAELLGV